MHNNSIAEIMLLHTYWLCIKKELMSNDKENSMFGIYICTLKCHALLHRLCCLMLKWVTLPTLWLWPWLDDVAIGVPGAHVNLAFNHIHDPKRNKAVHWQTGSRLCSQSHTHTSTQHVVGSGGMPPIRFFFFFQITCSDEMFWSHFWTKISFYYLL